MRAGKPSERPHHNPCDGLDAAGSPAAKAACKPITGRLTERNCQHFGEGVKMKNGGRETWELPEWSIESSYRSRMTFGEEPLGEMRVGM